MVNENYLMDHNYTKNLDFKEIETEIKTFKIKQNETFNFYIDSINKLIENVEKAKKNLEERKKKNIQDHNISINNNNITTESNDINKNNFDIKEFIKDVKNLKITEKISEENKKFYNILLLSYKGIISLIKQETPEILKNVYIKKNVILRLILLHFLQKGDFFMYYVLNNEILEKKKKKMKKKKNNKGIEKSTSKIDKLNNYSNEENSIISKDNNFLKNNNEINSSNKSISLNKSNFFSEKLLNNNFYVSTDKKKEEETDVKTSISEKDCNGNKNSKNEDFENNKGNKNNVIKNYNNCIYNNKEENKYDCNTSNNNDNCNNDKYSILLNNINTSNININNKESIFTKFKKEYISKIKYENATEEINFEHSLIEKEIFEGYKMLHTILYDLKHFKVDKCIDWYNNSSETIKKKYSKLIYLLHCINYLKYSKNDKEKALRSLRDLMINYKENKSHISRLSTFICIGVDNYFFKNMFSSVNSKIYNYFKRAFNEEGIVINIPSKIKMKKDKKKIDTEENINLIKDSIKQFTKNRKFYEKEKCHENKKFMKEKENSLNKNVKNETNDDKIDLVSNDTNKRSAKILIRKRRKNNNNNRSSSLISCKLEKKRKIKNKNIIKKKAKKNENILKRKIKKNNEKIKQIKKKKKRKIDSLYKIYQKEYALNIKINHNKVPLIHNNIYKEKYTSTFSEHFYNNINEENNFVPLCERYMENNINRLLDKERIKKNPFYYDSSNYNFISNNNLILPKVKINHKNSKSKNKNEEKLNKGWYKYVFNCTKDVFSEIVESQNDIKNLMKKDIKLNKGVDYRNYVHHKITEPIYLYELSENEFSQFYQNDSSYITYKILNKAAHFYDNNDTKISNNRIQNLNSGYNTNYVNTNNSIYNEYIYSNNSYNNAFCNISHSSFNYLNNSCFIRKPNMLKRKFPKCKFLSRLCKNEKTNEKNDCLSKEANPNDTLLDKKKKNEKNEDHKDNDKSCEIKETKKSKQLKEETTEIEYITSALKKHKKNEDCEYFNFKDFNEETNEYSYNSFYSDKSVSSNNSSDSSSENNSLNGSSYEENLKKKINKVKEQVELIKEDYLKKNTMTALLNTKNIQANNRAVLASKNNRLTKTSVDVSRILLTHALTTRDIYTLHNTLTNNKGNTEFRRICLKWKAKKIKPGNRLRKKKGNDKSNDDEKKKKKKKKRNIKIDNKNKEKKYSKNKKENKDDNMDDYKKKKSNKKRKFKFKYGNKKNDKFISIVKPSISHSLECFGLEEFIKLTKENLFVKKSDNKQHENKKISSKSKDRKNIEEKKKVDKYKDINKNIIKFKKEEKSEKENKTEQIENKENKEIETKKIENKENENKEIETKKIEKKENENKEIETKNIENKENENKENENKENENNENENKENEKKEKVNKENINKENENNENENKENTNKENENKENENKGENTEKIKLDEKEKDSKKKHEDEFDKKDKELVGKKKLDEIIKENTHKKDRNKINKKNNNEVDITEEEECKDKINKSNKNETSIKCKYEGDKINEKNKSEINVKKKDEKDKNSDDSQIKFKKEKKGVFYGSYKKNLKKRRYDSNVLLEENIMEFQMKRNKNEDSDFRPKKNKNDFRTDKNIKSLSTVKKEFHRKNSESSSSEDYKKKKDRKKIDEEKNKDKKKDHGKCNKKKKKKDPNKNEIGKGEKKKKNLKKIKSENYENKKVKKGKEEEKNRKKKKEKKVFIHLESPLSILICGGLISSKKLIEAQAILKENNKRLQEAKNNSLINTTSLKSSDKSTDKLEKEKISSTKKENGAFFSNSLAIEVDLSGCFFFHSSFTCPISRDKSSKDNPPYLLTCGHAICKNCVDKIHAQRSRQFKCPMCPQYLHLLEIIPLYFS
ncbi:zinc finger, C3HC4 type, putative [Plasmodium gallinaceum]|uniref:Zinc finger, C3HC4 type, putative n=1 Tax=Plasmodium gallinaceum TaxID=5849 RepID=A0A1J1GLK8_PLAGA|nr:zinc finger, C3HC4 type, putative [Plasmodium gallinaceum]CRG93257.1 zinc finger, C3HC4 type, putative [Plasmodium gallinaceum]